MITETIIKSLSNEPIKVDKKEPPQSSNRFLPALYFTSMFIGSKGTGKTYSLVRLLKYYEDSAIIDEDGNKREMRIILFCPTANSTANPIFKTLKTLEQEDIILQYSDGKLLEILESIQAEEKEIEEYAKYVKLFRKFKKMNDESQLDIHELMILQKYDFHDPLELMPKSLLMMKPKYKFPRVNFLVFDDLVGDSTAFKRNNSKLNNLTIKCRHHHCNMLFTTQYPKAIPPVIRNNIDIWVLFKFASKDRLLDQVYPEISSLITEEQFEELYAYATKNNNHDSLVVDNHNNTKKENRFRMNWNTILRFG